MSASEIQSWLTSATASGDDNTNDSQDHHPWQRDRVLDDWPRAIEYARASLLTSRTSVRVKFLYEEIVPLVRNEKITLAQLLHVFNLLTQTYPRYVDSGSRDAVEQTLVELLKQDALRVGLPASLDGSQRGVFHHVVAWLANQVGVVRRGLSSSYASADIFVLLSWSCTLYRVGVEGNPLLLTTQSCHPLLESWATLLDLILQVSSRSKTSLKKSAFVRTRRAFRSAPTMLPNVIETLLSQASSCQTPLTFIPLLGVAVDVTIRLKSVKDVSLTQISPKNQAIDGLLALYTGSILLSKTQVPSHVTTALHNFVKTFVRPDDLVTIVVPAMEKALLRAPEYSLTVVSSFFDAYCHSLDIPTFRKLLALALSSSKSTNSHTRAGAVDLLKTLLSKHSDSTYTELTVSELLALPKAGKTSGPDHRVALYSMLGLVPVPPTFAVSASIVEIAMPLLAKETHEGACAVLASTIPPHISFLLRNDTPLSPSIVALIAKEMNSSKPPLRRAFCYLIGASLWSSSDLPSAACLALASAILPSLEANLKTVATNPLNSTAGPLEGYIALAVLLGPFRSSGKFEDFLRKNATIQTIGGSSIKPSFLLWDKVYQKIKDTQDEQWLLRATEVTMSFLKKDLTKNESLRMQIGMVFLHLALDSDSPKIRHDALVALEAGVKHMPHILNCIISETLTLYISKHEPSAQVVVPISTSEEQEKPQNKQGRLAAFLLCAGAFAEDAQQTMKEELVADYIVLGHHPLISPRSRQTWVELCQKAGTDPHRVVHHYLDKLLRIALATSTSPSWGFADASQHAVSTLVFVSPELALPRIIGQLRTDLDPVAANALTDFELAVWSTPAGTAFVDVLASQRNNTQSTKGKDQELAKWEAELRKSLASKKGSAPSTLTKQEQSLVQAQLDKEARIREDVTAVKAKLERGLRFIHSIVDANVPEFKVYMSSVVSLLLKSALSRTGCALLGRAGFHTYLELSKLCSERLNAFRRWVGIATLRSYRVVSVLEELQAEPIDQLVIRVLYRLRSLSEQGPTDGATFSYFFPLLSLVMTQGGIGISGEEDGLEQTVLCLDVIKFHCGEFANPAFPRIGTIKDLVHVIRSQPKISKDASSALIDLGEAIYMNSTREEINLLLRETLSQEVYVRNSCLQTLQPFDLTDLDWSPELWIATHDEDEQNARLAVHLWDDNGLDVPEHFLGSLLDYLDHQHAHVRASAAVAISEAVALWPATVATTLTELQNCYRDKARILAPEFDEYGMVVASSLDRTDPWPTRLGIARTFQSLAPCFTENEVEPFFKFLLQDEALGDRASDVRRGMLNAGTAVIDLHGSTRLTALVTMFEEHIGAQTPATETADHIKEGVVILLGRVARHLDSTDPRIPTVVNRLVLALATPSEQVQIAVSDCLAPLMKLIQSSVGQLADQLFHQLFDSPKYGGRRGAAYGLAGVIKGTGLSGMKDFNVLARLRTATEDKTRYESRQGAMFAFETLSSTLGRLFEPYVIHILPFLLTCFGDSIGDVRDATQDAARIIMGNMSGYGVKLMLPSLLSGLEEKQWRTKKGSIELLGMMAYCSPRQLSLSLPIVIPRLSGVLTDSHAQVRAAANKSLKKFGEVISNPEIQSLVPVLLKALVDPAKTPNALTLLLKTSFMHYIDHSSLALVIPIIERGLRERGAETKKKAAQIVGNLASLTEPKDFVPYLSDLLPLVHIVLADPVPEARATAAKALGTLVERLGEHHFPDLVPGLLKTLKTDTSGVDRQGAAQGLSEVLSGLGMERLEGLLPDIIANAQSTRSTVREGFMSLLVYLPATFGTRFQPHLPKIIAPILGGLADSEEYVRDAAMRAGRMIVTHYSSKAIDLLLPELENGMFHSGWRIRHSSITLVGELLFKISGISGKTEIEQDDEVIVTEATESSRRTLVEVLGPERRNRILSTLYLVRHDGVSVVRQSSIHIWKALVQNTPRTVREILPELLNQIIWLVSGDEYEQQETAARTIAELCRKFGEKILNEIVPALKAKSTSSDTRTRAGVCLTLCDVVECTTDTQRQGHEDEIIAVVRISLVDDEARVRAAAARAFDILQEHMGARAIDQTIPTLLEALRQPGKGSGTALNALREVMSVRASTVFPILIPTLTAIPMTTFNARALGSLVTVAGNALSKRLTVILTAFATVIEGGGLQDDLKEAIDEALRASFASINDPEGLNTLMLLLFGWAKHDTPKRRVLACNFFATFCEESELDSSLYRVDWIRSLVSLLEDAEIPVHTAAWSALDVFVKSLPKDELEPLVVPLRRTIESTGGPGIYVPGFNLPKGVSPTVPIIIAGLTTGSNEQREQAAYAIGDLVERTEEDAIKPFVVPFTGPLIRVATQATTYPPAVKTAILAALITMLERIPVFVKPFFPQLQRTFVKSTSDASSVVVRSKAGQGLGALMRSQPRVDPVVAELIAGAKGAEENIAASFVGALALVVKSAGTNVGEKARASCVELVADAFKEAHDDPYIHATAALAVSLAQFPDLIKPIVQTYLVSGTPLTVLSSHMILALLSPDDDDSSAPYSSSPNIFPTLSVLRSVAQKVQESVGSDKPAIARPAREAKQILKELEDDSLQGVF